jgi:hypothetical protein
MSMEELCPHPRCDRLNDESSSRHSIQSREHRWNVSPLHITRASVRQNFLYATFRRFS